MFENVRSQYSDNISQIEADGLTKHERELVGPQGGHIVVRDGGETLNFCANNYLGLASHPKIIAAAHEALDRWGFGLSSVRFICGTQSVHKDLERRIAGFLGVDDAILYSSAFDANGGLFETILGPEDAVISDALNHASIIDGVRLCKAKRSVYATSDMADLEAKLRDASTARRRLIATDGVFSMDGTVADLVAICDLADRYDAMVMVDDSHATGVIGASGKGSHEYRSVMGRVDIITGTLGKALGGASGGFTAARQEIVDLLRQRSRPYLFSNTLAPPIAAAAIAAIDLVETDRSIKARLDENTAYFRAAMRDAGFSVPSGDHPIVPIMLGEARTAHQMADALLDRGIYVIGFSFPVVPKGEARIRVQVSAAHEKADLNQAVNAFAETAREIGAL